MNQNLHVNKTNFHVKGFAPGLTLKQRQNATQKSPKASAFLAKFKTHLLPGVNKCQYCSMTQVVVELLCKTSLCYFLLENTEKNSVHKFGTL